MAMNDDANDRAERRSALSRRGFLKGAGGAAASGALVQSLLAGTASAQAREVERLAGEVELVLDVNGEPRTVKVEPRTTLLDTLRDRCELTGTKLVCDRGNCGACTVLVDGEPAYACMLLAADLRGRKVRTIEGEGTPESMSALQAAFVERDASMCGFCTPGFVMALTACLAKKPGASLDDIKSGCAGNLCRCGTYPHIFDAALQVARGR
ncbi:MAG: (2Fe-2S)-binding protein [Planctomycetota bacterium]